MSVVVTSKGSGLPIGKSLTYKGEVTLYEDAETKAWFNPALPNAVRADDPDAGAAFQVFLDLPDRLIIAVTPEGRTGFDSQKMWQLAPAASPRPTA